MAKIGLMDTIPDVVLKLAEGNPGAVTCLVQMLTKRDWYGGIDPIMLVLMLDQMEIYGEKIYMLWNDCCGRDLTQMELVLRNFQLGRLPQETIKQNLAQYRGTPFKDLVPLEMLFERYHEKGI